MGGGGFLKKVRVQVWGAEEKKGRIWDGAFIPFPWGEVVVRGNHVAGGAWSGL